MVLRLTDRSRIFLTFLSLIGISGGIAAGCDSEQADELTSAARQAIVSDWASGVTYQADDLVGFDGSTYRCLRGTLRR